MSANRSVFDLSLRHSALNCVCAAWLILGCPVITLAQIGRPSIDLLEDRPEPLVPKKPRSEADEDRLLAAAQFGHARMMLQREQYAAALRGYERAFRNDPSTVIAREIIAVASELNRPAEAMRYAILSAEIEPPEGDLPLRLAIILGEQEEFGRAVRLLERVAEKEQQPPTGLPAILLQAEMMRMYFLNGQHVLAAKSADVVRDAIQEPDRFGLPPADQQKLKSQRERLYPLMAESYLKSGRLVEAEAAYRGAHEAKPNEALLNFGLARIAAEKKDWSAARERLKEFFQTKSTAAGLEPYELLNRIITGQVGDESRAKPEVVAALKLLREQDPKNNALGYATAATLLAAEQFDESAALYEELLTRQPTTTAFRDLAQIYRRKKDPVALLSVLGRAVDQGGSRDLFGSEGKVLSQDTALVNELVELLRSSAKERASLQTPSAFVAVSLIMIELGKIDIAKELYEKALTAKGSDPVKIRETIGLIALTSDQHRFAADVFQQAIAAKPTQDKLAAYYFYVAGGLEYAGDSAGALAAAEKAAELKRDSAQFQSRPAWVLYHSKQLEQAEQRYRDLINKFDAKFDSDEVRDQMRQARLILSNICVMQNRLPEAEEWLEQVLDESPENIGALNDLGYLWADQGKRLHRALRMVEQAVAAEPENFAYRDSLGWAYYRLGRYDDAVRELQRASTAGKDGVIYDHLGDVYLKLDDRKQALAAWKKGVELMTDPHEATLKNATTAKIEQYSKPM